MEIFIELFLIVTALAVVLNVIFKAFDIPTIIGYIIAGICLSQMANITHTKIIHAEEIVHVAEFGVVFLMFTIGLEFSFKHLMSMKKEVFFNGFLQMSCKVKTTHHLLIIKKKNHPYQKINYLKKK